jgi:hypothetical protein
MLVGMWLDGGTNDREYAARWEQSRFRLSEAGEFHAEFPFDC